jgi:hypothetical protein
MKRVLVIGGVVLLILTLAPGTPRQGASRTGLAVAGLSPGASAATDLDPTLRAPADPFSLAQSKIRADVDYGKLPVCFIPNRGQLDRRVAYYVEGKDKALYFTQDGITISLAGPANKEPFERYAVKLDFIGANRGVKPVGEDETGGVVSYFKGKPKDWKAGLRTYSRIVYRGLWPGIDLVYHGTVNRLKYEFIVRPGADPSMIRLAYRGAESLSVDGAGRLNVSTQAGSFQDDVPVAYQETGGQKTAVRLAYKLGAETSRAGQSALTFGFDAGAYDHSQRLILDPAIFIYCGYLGGSGEDYGRGIAVDRAGNVYITGETHSAESTFPVTAGPDLTFNGGTYDAFVAKVNATGTALVYCGYIGGSGDDYGAGIAVDDSGNAYVTGRTGSSEATFPVTAGPDLTTNGGADAFVAKVSPEGTALVYCGYIGGAGPDRANGIAVDASGNAYVTGSTYSTESTFPVTVGPDLTYNDPPGMAAYGDAFVAKVNTSGAFLDYCGYIGGAYSDLGNAIAVDASGHTYIAGTTTSDETTFPVVVGPGLTNLYARNYAFVAKLKPDGTGLDYCGYVPGASGSQADGGYGVAVDSQGCAYVTGFEGTVYGTKVQMPVGFIAKVAASGSALAYFYTISGFNVRAYGMAVDASGNSYVTGYAESLSAPTVGPDVTYNGGGDAFVADLDASGTKLVYCGFIGGSTYDEGLGIAVDSSGNAYVFGSTQSNPPSFPVLGGLDHTYNGLSDAFVAKIAYYETRVLKNCVGDFDGDGVAEAALDFGAAGAWMWNGGAWSQLAVSNTESLLAANVDGDNDDEIIADLGAGGLWLWTGPGWNQISAMNAEITIGADVDGDGSDELVSDFGALGLWLWDGGVWTEISGADAAFLTAAKSGAGGGSSLIADFGPTGLWSWKSGAWTELTGARAALAVPGNFDGLGGEDLAGDFGAFGLWLWNTSSWTQLTTVHADSIIPAEIDHNARDEIVADFGPIGTWLWNQGAWSSLSGRNSEGLVAADIDGDGAQEIAADFGTLGLWLWDVGAWNEVSGLDAETILAGDFDGDQLAELMVDFGTSGLWLWNGGLWSEINTLSPDQLRDGRASR